MFNRQTYIEKCRLCERPLATEAQWGWNDDVYAASCALCGSYRMTLPAYHSPLNREEGDFWLRAAARQYWEVMRVPLLIGLEDMERLAEDHCSTSVAQNVSMLLNHMVRKSPRPSTDVLINPETDITLVDALDSQELMFYVQHLIEAGIVAETGSFGAKVHGKQTYRLTFKGWDYALGTSATSAEHGRVFVAVWFDPGMESAYREGIEPALLTSGYQPVCMNGVFHSDDINFAILAELRRAQFVVADITGARGGVYFEAGFAKALGREVFFTCRKDRFAADKHFDTEHFQHTLWEAPSGLQEALRQKVLALKGPGPYDQSITRKR